VRAGTLHIADLGHTHDRGSEQVGRRPALIVHSHDYARIPNLALICPLTMTHRGVPNHVEVLPDAGNGLQTRCFVMTEQIRALDRRFLHRQIGSVSQEVLAKVLAILTQRLIAAP